MTQKVLVGMSGGVDSAVAASSLIDQGYEVIGATLLLWQGDYENKKENGKTCCSIDDVEDARSVANKLDIPFYVLNMKELFEEKVVDYFTASYFMGTTPNPCIACNRYIKFEAMLDKALALGADFIATGHYARIEFDEKTGRYLLKKAVDVSKDQSYVLYMLTQPQLKRLLLPLGNMVKTDTRKEALDKGLRVSSKPDSQDICFVEGGKYGDFIKKYTNKEAPHGWFVDRKGSRLGKHKGIVNYTIGQRKGLGISASAPLYVIEKNIKENTVVLGFKDETYTKSFTASEMNFIAFDEPTKAFHAMAKVRYSAKESEAVVTPIGENRVKVEFLRPQPFVAPGQAVVLYDGDLVIGGGTIDEI